MSNINLKDNSHRHYDYMLMALAPLIICACFIYSFRVLLVCGTALVTARIVDVGVAVLRKQEIDSSDKSSTVAALTFSMMLPVSIPLYIVVVTVSLVVLVGKHVFGGKDVYPFSLAALAMCLAAVNWPGEVFKAVNPLTNVNFWTGAAESTHSGLSQIKLGGLPYISTFDLLLGNHAAAMGSAFILVIIACGAFLLVSRVITWHIPVAFLSTCALFTVAFPRIYGVSRLYSLKYEMLCSAIFFYAVFMLNEPATTPKNPRAKIVFGVLTGLLTMLFRYYGSYEIGGCFALLLVNATEGFWDRLFDENGIFADRKSLSCDLDIGVKNHKPVEKKQPKPAVKKKTAQSEKPVKEENGKKLYKKETKQDKPVKTAKPKPAPKQAEKPQAKKPARKAAPRKPKEDLGATTTLDIIAQAEDTIDQVEFSTQTIDMEEALRAFEEKYSKGGK